MNYQPCPDCKGVKHWIVATNKPAVATTRRKSIDGNRELIQQIEIPANTAYLHINGRNYIPTITSGDVIPDGHDKTLAELWEEHGLSALEWSIPYTGAS